MEIYSYSRDAAERAISSMLPEPSLQRVCICKSPFKLADQPGFLASSARTSVKVRKPSRVPGGFGTVGGCSIHSRITRFRCGPTVGNSVNDRPSLTIAAASSSHKNALRDALRNAF